MGKVKLIGIFLVVAFVIYSFGSWLAENPSNAVDLAGGIGNGIRSMKDALGIFFTNVTK